MCLYVSIFFSRPPSKLEIFEKKKALNLATQFSLDHALTLSKWANNHGMHWA